MPISYSHNKITVFSLIRHNGIVSYNQEIAALKICFSTKDFLPNLITSQLSQYVILCTLLQDINQSMQIDKRQLARSNAVKKSTYFEKYRQQLSRISTQIEKETLKSSTLISLSRASHQSHQQNNNHIQHNQSPNSMRKTLPSHILPPPVVRQITTQNPLQSRTITDPANSPDARKTSGGQFSIAPSSSTYQRKVSLIFTEKSKQQVSAYQKEEYTHSRKNSDIGKEIEYIAKEHDLLKGLLQRKQAEIEQKRHLIQTLRVELTETIEPDYMRNIVSYAERIILIEQRIRQTKKNHEDLLSELAKEKTQIHAQNVQLSKQIETYDEVLQRLKHEYEIVDLDSPNKHLQRQTSKLLAEISRLQGEYESAEKRRNNSQELEELGQNQFNKYKQAWIKKFIGREIAAAEDRIRFRHSEGKIQTLLDKKKNQLRDKRIQIMVRQKTLLESCKVVEQLQRAINQKKEEINKITISTSERKLSLFNFN